MNKKIDNTKDNSKTNDNQLNITVLAQYIKDLSFENPNAPQIFFKKTESPKIDVNIDINASKIQEESYEIVLKISIEAKDEKENKKSFIIELSYASLFKITNVQSSLEQILLIYCPGLIFPYAREIISNLTMRGGFPPLMLNPIDFAALYQKRKKQMSENKNSENNNGNEGVVN